MQEEHKLGYKVHYGSGDGIIEVFIRDQTGARIDKFVVNQLDAKGIKKISAILRDKYGVDFTPPKEKGFFDY